MSKQSNLKEVYWGRFYPRTLENGQLYLVLKNSAFKLIYEVFLKKTSESIGTCHVLENADAKKRKKTKFVVKEYVAKSKQLNKRLGDIQMLIQEQLT